MYLGRISPRFEERFSFGMARTLLGGFNEVSSIDMEHFEGK